MLCVVCASHLSAVVRTIAVEVGTAALASSKEKGKEDADGEEDAEDEEPREDAHESKAKEEAVFLQRRRIVVATPTIFTIVQLDDLQHVVMDEIFAIIVHQFLDLLTLIDHEFPQAATTIIGITPAQISYRPIVCRVVCLAAARDEAKLFPVRPLSLRSEILGAAIPEVFKAIQAFVIASAALVARLLPKNIVRRVLDGSIRVEIPVHASSVSDHLRQHIRLRLFVRAASTAAVERGGEERSSSHDDMTLAYHRVDRKRSQRGERE